ncbi:hypothetical protein MVEN_02294800 [Mycena venus]|uniref:Uncharacterized protein n=1 Tax=Mycena venus TaxID=2733690 RepID=A0A8H6X5C9_9AGAR|nr:hypothetical protein MVEN_02294800 [Mycena venus]
MAADAEPSRPRVTTLYNDPLTQSALDLQDAMRQLRAKAKYHVQLAEQTKKLDGVTTRFARDVLRALPSISDKYDTTMEAREAKIHASREMILKNLVHRGLLVGGVATNDAPQFARIVVRDSSMGPPALPSEFSPPTIIVFGDAPVRPIAGLDVVTRAFSRAPHGTRNGATERTVLAPQNGAPVLQLCLRNGVPAKTRGNAILGPRPLPERARTIRSVPGCSRATSSPSHRNPSSAPSQVSELYGAYLDTAEPRDEAPPVQGKRQREVKDDSGEEQRDAKRPRRPLRREMALASI